MKKATNFIKNNIERMLDKLNLGLRSKLIIIFLLIKVIPLIVIALIAWSQFAILGETLRTIGVRDASEALNASAIENIERMTTDTALKVAEFLYQRDSDILYLAKFNPYDENESAEENYRKFAGSKWGRVIKKGEWEIAPDGKSWERVETPEMIKSETESQAIGLIRQFIYDSFGELLTDEERANPQIIDSEKRKRLRELSEEQKDKLRSLGLTDERIGELLSVSTNDENNDPVTGASFNYRASDYIEYENIPLYDEITFIDLDGNEIIKIVSEDSPKSNYKMNRELVNVSEKENTYVKAETYFKELGKLKPDEVYVSDVIGAYVGSNYIGMYTPEILKGLKDAEKPHVNAQMLGEIGSLPHEEFLKEAGKQAFAGKENPNGQRFEGIIRWATPVTGETGEIIGYVTFALNHDHIMEFVDHITPMEERYTELSSAYDGNYAFIWDYKCRSICHPRHNSIVGFDPDTGEPQVPWLETSIYEAWQESGTESWVDFVNLNNIKTFNEQSRSKKPAPELTKAGLVGLDGRYLNNAPQCTGWMDLTEDGGSGSFYILWSGLYKLTTAAAIPYYTGQYAPSEGNGYSRRGFGIVTIGAGLEDFQQPAAQIDVKLTGAVESVSSGTYMQLITTTGILLVVIVFIAVWISSYLTGNITKLIKGISRFRRGERQFRFNSQSKDEFGILADSFDDMADSIVDSVNRPMSIIDMSHKILYMNDYGLSLRKKSAEEIVGTSYEKNSIYPYGSKYCPITALKENRVSEVYYSEINDRYMQGVADYFLDKDNNRIGYIITSTDVTDMILTQIKLEQAVNDATEASKHKGDFLARMSHEIRTPMNAIIGLSGIVQRKLENIGKIDALADGDSRELKEIQEVKSDVNHIETSSQHLLGLLNDILDISKIEAGKIDISEENTDLSRLINEVAGIIRPRCDDKNIRFEVIADPFERQAFITDPLRLRQVLINLLGNSVKFTSELGTIQFRVENKGRRDGKTLVGFSVSDTGIGISEDKLAVIFEPFDQGGAETTKQFGGTGLGLSISRSIVRMMGGDIEIASKVGEGSEFRFDLWLRESESKPYESEMLDATDRFAGKRALLVDDVEINRMIAKSMLEITGIETDESEDGINALEMFKESAEGTYDIIFMDVQMPNMNGYEATAAIRGLDRRDAKNVPIIALTANAFKDDIEKALESGMNAHIAKPIEMDKIAESLFKFLGGQ